MPSKYRFDIHTRPFGTVFEVTDITRSASIAELVHPDAFIIMDEDDIQDKFLKLQERIKNEL